MTREELIERICPTDIISGCCSEDCDFVCEDCNNILNCMLDEYEKQIRDKALDEMAKANHIAINRLYDDIFENNGKRPSRNKIHKTLSRVLVQLKGKYIWLI